MQTTITVCDYCNGHRRPAVDSMKVVSATKGAFTIDVCKAHLDRVLPKVHATRRKAHASVKQTRRYYAPEKKARMLEQMRVMRKAGDTYKAIGAKMGVAESVAATWLSG